MSNMFKKHPTSLFYKSLWTCQSCLPCPTHYLEPMSTCSKGTQLCLFNKRPEPLVCILLQLSSALQKIFFNQFGVAKVRIQLHPWLPLLVVISYLRYWWWPVMTTCFDPEFCFLRLIWVFFPSCVLLRTDLSWLFLGVCVLSTHHRVQRVVEMQCT